MSYWNQAAGADYITALEEIVVVLMIEKRQAVEQLDEILAVPGIDMIQWGPADYAMSIGRPGGFFDPDVREVEKDVLTRALAAGVQPRAEINDPSEAQRFLDLGVTHFAIGTDMQILANWWRERGAGLADILGVVPGAVVGDR